MKTIELKIEDVEIGFCRVTYFHKTDTGQKLYYCLQDEGDGHGGVRLYRSSWDYEPISEIRFKPEYKVTFERVPTQCSLAKKINSFIKEMEK